MIGNWLLKLAQEVNKEKEVLEEKVKHLTKELYTDPLTQLYSRRFLEEKFDELVEGKDYHMIMLDIDNFKQINDEYGHKKGDEVLVGVAERIKKLTRGNDYVGRYGGEEIVILSLEQDDEVVEKLANRIRAAIEDSSIAGVEVTVSGGVASSERGVEETFKLADKALYKSKETGKNKITIYEKEMVKKYHTVDDKEVEKSDDDNFTENEEEVKSRLRHLES